VRRLKNALKEWIDPAPPAPEQPAAFVDLPLAAPPLPPVAQPTEAAPPLPTIAAPQPHPVERATFKQRAQAIADQYVSELPADYCSRHSAIADYDVLETLFRAVSAGLNQRDSCAAAGIHPTTFQRWMNAAEDEPTSAYAALAADLKAARAAGKLAHLENIKKHSAKEWTASAWTLERTDPEQFGKRDAESSQPKVVVQIGVKDGDVTVALSPNNPPVLSEGGQKR
jgi:hypothetical protein